MNLEELKSRLEKGFHADEKELYADIFNPSLVSKLLRVVEAAQKIEERFGPVRDDQIFSKRIALDKLFSALRDLEQS